ncbi:hypothetical protein FACS1894172_07820 [Spirochaetia bacterium]|nr:hypothetical protein FACS1894164_06100 [Spirochaetia bacterium]GHU31985.1 hypothetical protein FACS1894172_07820 [Spirochaetia bacterium]
MTKEQEKTVELLIEEAKKDKNIIGIILCGSLAKNTGNKNSDVDIFVIVNDIEFEKRRKQKNYFWGTNFETSIYPVEIDGKIINKDFIKRIWKNGNECIKNTFNKVRLLYSCDEEIGKLLEKRNIINLEKEENIRKFYALMKSNKFKAADDMANIIQMKYCVFNTVYFACRLILEHNNIYYPCIKNLEKELNNCINRPDDFIKNMHKVLEEYSLKELDEFYNSTEKYFKEYRFDDRIRKGYVIENENYWFFNERPYSEI